MSKFLPLATKGVVLTAKTEFTDDLKRFSENFRGVDQDPICLEQMKNMMILLLLMMIKLMKTMTLIAVLHSW